jgi:predicted ATPase
VRVLRLSLVETYEQWLPREGARVLRQETVGVTTEPANDTFGGRLEDTVVRVLGRAAPGAPLNLSAGTLQFLFLITVLMAPSPPHLIVVEEPEQYLHPSMLPIIAEHAVDAAHRTQIVFTTRSPQLLDAFADTRPTATVLECREGRTHLATLSGERLEAYSLGRLFTAGILENEL